jgi:hypothetical protein
MTTAGIRRQGLNAVGRGGRDAAAVGFGDTCIFLEIFDSSIYFSEIKVEKIYKSKSPFI